MSRIIRIKLPDKVLTWEEAMDNFLLWKKAQAVSEQTILDYKTHLSLFQKRHIAQLASFEHLKNKLLNYLGQDNIKPSTYNNRLVYLRSFLNWCVEQEYIAKNPLAGIKKRKDEGRRVSISLEILQRLLALPDRQTFAGLRDNSLMLLTLDTGIRPKEAFALLLLDFNPEAAEIYIKSENAKTRVSRTLPISRQTVIALKNLINARSIEWTADVPIFCTYEGKKLNRHTWGDRMEIYSRNMTMLHL